MGFFKALRALSAAGSAEAGTATRREKRPTATGGLLAVMTRAGSVMGEAMVAAIGLSRGAALPGSAPDAPTRAANADQLEAGVAALRSKDSAFDPTTLMPYCDAVFAAVTQAWATGSPAGVRPVLAEPLFEPLAAALALPMTANFQPLLGALTATGVLSAAHTDDLYDSVVVTFTVTGPDLDRDMPHEWPEDWLFQRSRQVGGDPWTYPDTCPNCGSPSQPTEAGTCSTCRAELPVLTSGWLASHIQSSNPMGLDQAEHLEQIARDEPETLHDMPDFLLRQISPDVLAEVAPDIAARLRA